jgi:hypothetical protein
VFQGIDLKEQSATTTGQGFMRLLVCYEEIPKENKPPFSRQNSLLDFFKPSSG